MSVIIKKLETDEEIRGKAFVFLRAWHEAYTGIVSRAYLDSLTLESCEEKAFRRTDGVLIAKDGERVIGFVSFGDCGEEKPEFGEVFCLYVLSEYYGTGAGQKLMEAALNELKNYPKICLWVLKENGRAVRFYQKCGFVPDGEEAVSANHGAAEIRMVLELRR